MKPIIIFTTIMLLVMSDVGGFVGLKKLNKENKVISERKLMIWSNLSLIIALVNIVYLIYTYFSDFNS